jgi:hypothetical protein
MLRVLKLRRSTTYATSWLDKFHRIQRLAALITLVTPRPVKATVGAGALNVSVRQKALAGGTEGLLNSIFIYIVLIKKGDKDVLCYLGMIGSAGSSKQIKGDAQLLPVL